HQAIACFISLLSLATLVACESEDAIKSGATWTAGVTSADVGRTFDWAPVDRQDTGDPRTNRPALHELLHEVIERDLASRGYALDETGTPDFWVDYRVQRRTRLDQYRGAGFKEFEEGTLVIYIVDPQARDAVWHGWAQARLSDDDTPEAREEKIKTAVALILEQLSGRQTQ
ncbi:MAG: DUF4136 domain-containing protein, partial [Planctomycetota bacterium]